MNNEIRYILHFYLLTFTLIFLPLQTVSFISCCTWFLVVGALNHYKDEESIASPTFWSFMSFVFFIPGGAALIMLMVVLHLVNYVSVKNIKTVHHLLHVLMDHFLAKIEFLLIIRCM